jgi:hypothetical protein
VIHPKNYLELSHTCRREEVLKIHISTRFLFNNSILTKLTIHGITANIYSTTKPHTTLRPTTRPTMPVTTIPHLSASNTESESPSTPSPVFFWQPNRSNGDLSQWSCSPFTLPNGEAYTTAEMWMMVQKARLFGDEAVAKKMLATSDPKRHRALGREVRGFNERVWDARK